MCMLGKHAISELHLQPTRSLGHTLKLVAALRGCINGLMEPVQNAPFQPPFVPSPTPGVWSRRLYFKKPFSRSEWTREFETCGCYKLCQAGSSPRKVSSYNPLSQKWAPSSLKGPSDAGLPNILIWASSAISRKQSHVLGTNGGRL